MLSPIGVSLLLGMIGALAPALLQAQQIDVTPAIREDVAQRLAILGMALW
jgi:hypothetical protein